MGHTVDALRISPHYTAEDWRRLDSAKAEDWPRAVAILKDRLQGRFIQFADDLVKHEYSGFALLVFDSMLIETLQQFIEGKSSKGQSEAMFKRFLVEQFPAYFDEAWAKRFYTDVRCGLLHQAATQGQTLVRRRSHEAVTKIAGGGFEIHPVRFHGELKAKFDQYCADLVLPSNTQLREKLWTRMDEICQVREARTGVFVA